MDNFTRAHLVPDLWAVNRSTGAWMKVRDTCPTPRWVVDRVAKTYEVDGCNFNPGPPIPVEEGRRLDAAEVPHHPRSTRGPHIAKHGISMGPQHQSSVAHLSLTLLDPPRVSPLALSALGGAPLLPSGADSRACL